MKNITLIEAINHEINNNDGIECMCSARIFSDLTGIERNEIYRMLGILNNKGIIEIKRRKSGNFMEDIITIKNEMYRT